jgi:uncharacterized membrane protein YccC
MLLDRLFDTSIGIVVGLAVNMMVWPPLRDYSAAKAIDAVDDTVGGLLSDMALRLRDTQCTEDDVRAWVHRTRMLDQDIERAWVLLRQAKESGRLNPRRAAQSVKKTDVFEEILELNEQAVAELRSLARTLGHSIDGVIRWEPEFRDRWIALLDEAGEAIGVPDSARVAQVRVDLTRLAEDMSTEQLSGLHWPEYGALIMNLRNIVASMDRVAEQNPVVLPRYARRDRLLRSSVSRRQAVKG